MKTNDNNTANNALVEGCHFTTSGCYGDCWNCHVADDCPTWQGVSAERAYVDPADPYTVVDIQ